MHPIRGARGLASSIPALLALSMTCPFAIACSAAAAPVDSGDPGDDGEETGSGSGGGSTPAPPACQYPTATYGVQVGATVNPALSWQGYPEHSADPATVAITDYLDCDGTKNINALLVIESATWCEACQVEASELGGKLAGVWDARGIHVITLMIEDLSSHPATVQTALAWKNQYGLQGAVAADPALSFVGYGSGGVGLPVEVVVDPRTMTVVDRQEGYSGVYPALEQVATKNGH